MIAGNYRPDGSFIGFDYSRQTWIDTRASSARDTKYGAGSACNPLSKRPVCPVCEDSACEVNDETCGN